MLIVNREMNIAVNLDAVDMLGVNADEFPYTVCANHLALDSFNKKEDAIREFNRIIDAYAANRRVYYIE